MTSEERHMLMTGVGWMPGNGYMGMGYLLPGYYMGNTPPISRLGVPPLKLHDAGNGFRNNPMADWNASAHGFGTTTCWPSALALASAWDEDLVQRVAAAIAREFEAKGANVVLGPGIQVHRVARNGRNFEYMSGEDPYLGGRLAAAYVHGVQKEGLVACAKHWAFNEQETDRFSSTSDVDERTAWELYYPPFEAAVEAGIGSVMCGYNKVNGTYSCENEALLRRDLKERMGFRGFVVSDWWATRSPSVQHGLDQEMPGVGVGVRFLKHGPHYSHDELEYLENPETRPWWSRWLFWGKWRLTQWYAGLKFGFFDREGNAPTQMAAPGDPVFKDPARRVLAAIYRLRLEERPGCTPGSDECKAQLLASARAAEHEELNREAAARSVVLLRNEGVLPLDKTKFKKVAIVGNALISDSLHMSPRMMPPPDPYSGGGSGHVGANLDTLSRPLEALRKRAATAGIEVLVSNCTGAGGCSENVTKSFAVAEAVKLAREADVVLVVIGGLATEGEDRATLRLDKDGISDAVITAVAGEKPTAVLLQVPGVVLMPWREQVDAIACMFLGGEQTGHAWASVVFGDLSPSAKLPIMLPTAQEDTIEPATNKVARYSEGLFTSYRSASADKEAAFPFGHGLSYTTFEYGEVRAAPAEECAGAKGISNLRPREVVACVTASVTNAGGRAGADVAQAYVEFPAAYSMPRLMLRGMHRTRELQPGEREVALFALTQRDLSVFQAGRWQAAGDGVVVHIGASSADLRAAVTLGGGAAAAAGAGAGAAGAAAEAAKAAKAEAGRAADEL